MAEIKFKTRSNKVNYGDSFWIEFSQYCYPSDDRHGKKIKDITNTLTEKKFTIKNTDASYRAINHWSRLGLLDDSRSEETKGWRKFSVVDLVWLKALGELRQFGVALDKIKVGYEALKEFDRLLEFGIFSAIMRNAIYLVVFSDGYIELANREALSTGESLGFLQDSSYLVISINNFLKDIFPNNDLRPHLDHFQLSEKEISVLAELRMGKHEQA